MKNLLHSRQKQMKIVSYPKKFTLRWKGQGTSLVVQWLRLCTPNARGPGSILGQGTRSHMLGSRSSHASMEDPACQDLAQPNK